MAIIEKSKRGNTLFQKLLGHHEIYDDWNKLATQLESKGQLSAKLKEEVRRMLAQNNHCQYCKAKGKPQGNILDEKEQICIGFVDVYLKVGENIPNEVIRLLKQYLTNIEIVELIAFISFTNCQQQFGALMKLEALDES
ncbi:carboxymuconolactone decarboxylase family protein [Staphylococcus pasteuri]|uniref:carboxymuconolactone decarboxylase family protein n=1 Tax=Staphylococcus pasteuri TaxID=45972 RepID=UPI0032606B9E